MTKPRKYEPIKLVAMFRLAAALRKQMVDLGFTDNGGAIHSAERILNLMGIRLCYPGLTHINSLRHHPLAPFSRDALIAFQSGQKVLIEHVSPLRALTRLAIEHIEAGASDAEFMDFIKSHFKLALLTPAETIQLNRLNRSRMTHDRLESAGIQLSIRGDENAAEQDDL